MLSLDVAALVFHGARIILARSLLNDAIQFSGRVMGCGTLRNLGAKLELTEPQQAEARRRRKEGALLNLHAATVSEKVRFRDWRNLLKAVR